MNTLLCIIETSHSLALYPWFGMIAFLHRSARRAVKIWNVLPFPVPMWVRTTMPDVSSPLAVVLSTTRISSKIVTLVTIVGLSVTAL
jgi:hypothetical protein